MFFTQYWAQHNPESRNSGSSLHSTYTSRNVWSHRLPRRGEPDLKDWEHTAAPLNLISNCRPRQTRESNLKTELTTREKSKNPFKCYPQNRLNDITWFYNHIHGLTISNTAHRNRNCSIETKPFPESSLFTRKHDVTSDMTCVGIELKSSWAISR